MGKKEYEASKAVLEAEEAARGHGETRPGAYQSEYGEALKKAMDKILNAKDFSYHLNGDALYRQYRNQAVRDGRLAMHDTMGQAAALTGGYGNSYAQSVGQQAYARQLDGLADKIPALYNLAIQQYQLRSQGLKDRYNLLAGADQEAYSRYADSLAAWQEEADRLWQRYTDARDTDYGAYRDEIADWKWQQEYEEEKRRYDQEWDEAHSQPKIIYRTKKKKDAEESKSSPGILGALVGALNGVRKK